MAWSPSSPPTAPTGPHLWLQLRFPSTTLETQRFQSNWFPSTRAYLASSCSCETGGDLGPFAAMLAPVHTSPRATKYKETVGKAKDPAGYYRQFTETPERAPPGFHVSALSPASRQSEPWWPPSPPSRTVTVIPLLPLRVHEQLLGPRAPASPPDVPHLELQWWKGKVKMLVTQSCPTLQPHGL